jgi:hypothetical protein
MVEISSMTTGLTVTRRVVGEGHIIFARSDGEVFHLMLHEDGQASLFQNDKAPPDGISLDVNIPDKPAQAEKLILAYPNGWP